MKHYILCKFLDPSVAAEKESDIRELFSAVLALPGVHAVAVIPNVVARPNRYDLLIRIDMEKEALEAYDHCPAHLRWKEEYGPLLEKKAIFDAEE